MYLIFLLSTLRFVISLLKLNLTPILFANLYKLLAISYIPPSGMYVP